MMWQKLTLLILRLHLVLFVVQIEAFGSFKGVGTQVFSMKMSQGIHVSPVFGEVPGRSLRLRMDFEQKIEDSSRARISLRDRLRRATGFSLTVFRGAWRAATGISLTAIYATALAASGLWIRKATSAVLSIFPGWFRYYLQPFLILYYLPMFIIRGLAGPTRKHAKERHEAVMDSWREAVDFAKETESGGYWPVKVNGNGDFELVSPPKPKDSGKDDLADAVAESVERAMEEGYRPENLSQ